MKQIVNKMDDGALIVEICSPKTANEKKISESPLKNPNVHRFCDVMAVDSNYAEVVLNLQP
jgi:hypothetical protein